MQEQFNRGDAEEIAAEMRGVAAARQPVYRMLAAFENELQDMGSSRRRGYRLQLKEVKDLLHELLGPRPASWTW